MQPTWAHGSIMVDLYEDSLAVTDAQTLCDFIFSGLRHEIDPTTKAHFLAFLGQEIALADGVLPIDKEVGILIEGSH